MHVPHHVPLMHVPPHAPLMHVPSVGGEKRRVSIAVELLTRPGVLFLDEPTTGLDSTNAAKVVDIMAGLAQQGVTVIMSIHQPRPDIFRLMDRVLLLSGEGQVEGRACGGGCMCRGRGRGGACARVAVHART